MKNETFIKRYYDILTDGEMGQQLDLTRKQVASIRKRMGLIRGISKSEKECIEYFMRNEQPDSYIADKFDLEIGRVKYLRRVVGIRRNRGGVKKTAPRNVKCINCTKACDITKCEWVRMCKEGIPGFPDFVTQIKGSIVRCKNYEKEKRPQ